MKKLYFARHGLSEMNIKGVISGSTETPLSYEGRIQAKAAGEQAKNLDIDYIICSPLSRAHETAIIIAEEIGYPIDKIEVNSLLIERHFGALEGQPWAPDLDMDGIADIESVDSILNRAKLMLEHIETIEADNILVVSHGSFGRAVRHHLFPDQPYINKTSSGKNKLQNAEIVQWV